MNHKTNIYLNSLNSCHLIGRVAVSLLLAFQAALYQEVMKSNLVCFHLVMTGWCLNLTLELQGTQVYTEHVIVLVGVIQTGVV